MMRKTLFNHPNAGFAFASLDKILHASIQVSDFRESVNKGLGWRGNDVFLQCKLDDFVLKEVEINLRSLPRTRVCSEDLGHPELKTEHISRKFPAKDIEYRATEDVPADEVDLCVP